MADEQPDLQSGVVNARAAGYSDDEIADHLADTVPGIKKARDAGYSNSEIIAHLAGGDASDKAPQTSDNGLAATAKDVATQIGSGAVQGVVDTATMIPRIAGAAKSAANKYLFDPILGPPPAAAQQAPDLNATATQAGDAVNNSLPDPKTTWGKYARTAGAFLPNVVGGPESLLSRVLSRAVAPGIASEAAGQATAGTALEPYARIAGAVAGGGVAGAAMAPRQASQALPDIDAVRAEASRLYNDPAVKNLRVDPTSVNNLGGNIASSLEGRGMFREDHAPVYNAVDRLTNATGPVSYDQLDAVRKALGSRAGEIDAFGRPTPTSAAASHASGLLDDYIANDMTNPANVLSGNPVQARVFMHNARQNSGAAIRAEQVARQIGNAQNDAAATNSGMNVQNRIRQKLKTFIQNDGAKMGGYTDAEQAQMQRLVRGSMLMNGLRHVGNAIGGSGISVIPGAYIGHATLGPIGTALPAVGIGLKHLANIATQRMANNMSNTLLQRAPLVQRTLAANRAISNANRATTQMAATHGALRALAASLITKQNAP